MNRQMAVTQINTQVTPFSLTPRTLDEAMQYAKLICDSDFCPKEHRGKPGNVLIAIQYGAELGLSPMQALQNISIINGRPCVWGDALLGLVMAHPTFVNIHEEIKNNTAYCTLERKNKNPVQCTFSIDDAKKANLWGKAGTWTGYPNRMLQLRARTFALRDLFPDVLKGITTREEVEDFNMVIKKPIIKMDIPLPEKNLIETEVENENLDALDLKADIDRLNSTNTLDELKSAFESIIKVWQKKKNLDAIKEIIFVKDSHKEVLEFNAEIDQDTGEVK